MTRTTRRMKPAHLVHVADLAQADLLLAELAELQRRSEAIEGEMNQRIDQAKAWAAAESAPLAARREAISTGLAAFAEYQRSALFQHRRSVELTFGAFGFRRSQALKPQPKMRWADVLEKLKGLGLREGVRVREEVNRDTLRQWSDERLVLVGVRRVEQDQFWYQLQQQEIAQ